MPTYPLPTLAPTINSSGISIPSYSDILLSLIASFQAIYGADIYIAPDSQDGQWLAVLAQAQHDSNLAAVKVYQSFSPTYAQGIELSSLVKINGLMRQAATYSTATGNVVGVAGTIITNGIVTDINGGKWNLPTSVTIPIGGSITVTVTAQTSGAMAVASGNINTIANPQLGWQSFASITDSVPGTAIEPDAILRARQVISTSLPSQGIKVGIMAALGNVPGVTRYTVYENDTGAVDVNGLPAHSFTAVVEGGAVADIAAAINSRKPPGIQTNGTTSSIVTDIYGLPTTINYDTLVSVPIYFDITIKALPGYVSTTGDALKAALSAFINTLVIGEDVYVSQAQAAAMLINQPLGQTYYITAFKLGIAPAPVGTTNLTIAYDTAASSLIADIGLTVT